MLIEKVSLSDMLPLTLRAQFLQAETNDVIDCSNNCERRPGLFADIEPTKGWGDANQDIERT